MRLLFTIDTKDYNLNGIILNRPSCRSIIIKNGKVAMVHSLLYDYYKFPGGGIENNENKIDCLIRETKEEAGLVIIKDSIKEFGYVHRIQKSDQKDKFDVLIQDNYYYLCEVENEIIEQQLDDYEDKEHFTLEFVNPIDVLKINLNKNHGPKDMNMISREARVLQILIDENYIK